MIENGCLPWRVSYQSDLLRRRLTVSHIWDKIFNDIHMRQRIDLDHIPAAGRILTPLLLIFNVTKTSQGIPAIDIHGTRSTYTLAARAAESEGGILFGFDFDEGV